MNRQFLNMLGLCMKAGKLLSGEQACLGAIRGGTALLIVIDGGASENTKKMFSDSCDYYQVPMVFTSEDELGYAIGKPARKSAAVTDESFALRIRQLADPGACRPAT